VALFALGRRFWGRTAGVVGALLYLLNPLQLYYAQQARAYSLELLLDIVSWFALLAALRAAEHRRRWWWAGYVGATTLAFYAHVYTALLVAAQLVALGTLLALPTPWRARVRAALRPLFASLMLIGILIVPLALVSRNGGPAGWVPAATGQSLYNLAVRSISDGSLLYFGAMGAAAVLTILAALAFCLPLAAPRPPADPTGTSPPSVTALASPTATRSPAAPAATRSPAAPSASFVTSLYHVRDRLLVGDHEWTLPFALALACWLLVPVALSFAVTQRAINLHLFLDRYLVVIVPALCLLIGAGVGVILPRWPWARAGVALGLVLVAARLVPAYYPQADTRSFHAATAWLEQRYQPGDGLACYPSFWCRVPMTFELTAAAGPAQLSPASPGATYDTQTLAAYAATHPRVILIVAIFNPRPIHPTTASAPPMGALSQWMRAHYHLVDQMVTLHPNYQDTGQDILTGVSVAIYATGGPPGGA
jgi:uncharacterized membrane protein